MVAADSRTPNQWIWWDSTIGSIGIYAHSEWRLYLYLSSKRQTHTNIHRNTHTHTQAHAHAHAHTNYGGKPEFIDLHVRVDFGYSTLHTLAWNKNQYTCKRTSVHIHPLSFLSCFPSLSLYLALSPTWCSVEAICTSKIFTTAADTDEISPLLAGIQCILCVKSPENSAQREERRGVAEKGRRGEAESMIFFCCCTFCAEFTHRLRCNGRSDMHVHVQCQKCHCTQ